MEKQKQTLVKCKLKNHSENGAKLSLLVLHFYIIIQLAAVFYTRYQLKSPLIPEITIWEINKQYIFHALIYAGASVMGIIFYFFGKHWIVIILTGITILVNRFIQG